nr:P3 [Botryosphaeria dothidea chrysovirus 1]
MTSYEQLASSLPMARVTNWADAMNDELDGLGLDQVARITDPDTFSPAMLDDSLRVDYSRVKSQIPAAERAKLENGLGCTAIMRRGTKNRSTVPPGYEMSRTCCGLPYGPDVASIAWTDADLHIGTDDQVSKTAYALVTAFEREVGRVGLMSEHPAQVYKAPCQDLYISGIGLTWYCIQLRDELTLYVCLRKCRDRHEILDVATNSDLSVVREYDRAMYCDLMLALSALQFACVEGQLVLNWPLLQDAPLKGMAKLSRRTGAGAVSVEYGTGGPTQVFDSQGRTLSQKQVVERRVPITYITHSYAGCAQVCHGVMSAGDVPASLAVTLASGNGKSLSGTAMAVRRFTGGFFIAATTATSNMSVYGLRTGYKERPMTRDGLLSPACTAALYGTGYGGVYVTINRTHVALNTALERLSPTTNLVVADREPYKLQQYVLDVCSLQGWTAVPTHESNVDVYGEEDRFLGRVEVRYGYNSGPRWAALLPRWDFALDCGSELPMDYGCSGLGRFLLAPNIRKGQFVGIQKMALNRKGPFAMLAQDVFKEKRLSGSLPMPTCYVVDTEYMQRKRGEHLERFVYAVGIAKFSNGRYHGSCCVIDDSKELQQFVAANPREAERQLPNWQKLLRQATPGDPATVLQELAALAKHPDVRLYAKGADVESELLASDYSGATRLFTRQNRRGFALGELGHLVEQYDTLARKVSWPIDHNPAREAVLFGHMAGLSDDLPPIDEIGQDRWVVLRHCAMRQLV